MIKRLKDSVKKLLENLSLKNIQQRLQAAHTFVPYSTNSILKSLLFPILFLLIILIYVVQQESKPEPMLTLIPTSKPLLKNCEVLQLSSGYQLYLQHRPQDPAFLVLIQDLKTPLNLLVCLPQQI